MSPLEKAEARVEKARERLRHAANALEIERTRFLVSRGWERVVRAPRAGLAHDCVGSTWRHVS